MGPGDVLLMEFNQEMAGVRKCLERMPDEKFDWRPHEKSMTLGRLATHLCNMPSWVVMTVQADSFDVAPEGGEPVREETVASTDDALAMFDRNVAAAREAIAGASPESFGQPWSLLSGGEAMFTMPRIAVLKGMVVNHAIHHRAQLGLYLRMNDVPVPALYGPSADEGP